MTLLRRTAGGQVTSKSFAIVNRLEDLIKIIVMQAIVVVELEAAVAPEEEVVEEMITMPEKVTGHARNAMLQISLTEKNVSGE